MTGTVKKLPNADGGYQHTTVGQGKWVGLSMGKISAEGFLDLVGGTATIEVHGSNIGAGVVPSEATRMLTIDLSGVNDRASQTKPDAMYCYMCANVTAITGGATAVVVIGG